MAQQPQTRPATGKLLPPEPLLFPTELFKMICKQEDRELRKRMLVEYTRKDAKHAQVLQSIAELAWHPAVVWDLPEGAPPFAPSTPHLGQAPTSLFKCLREASRFLKGGGGYINNMLKREKYFAQILESLAGPEANLLIAIKDKNIEQLYPYIRLDLFTETFPQWFPAEVVKNTRPFLEKVQVKEEPIPPKEEPYLPNGTAGSNYVHQSMKDATEKFADSLNQDGMSI